MYKFQMPIMELVSFSADDIIRTSEGGGSNNFDIGNSYTNVQRDLMSDMPVSWSNLNAANTGKMES